VSATERPLRDVPAWVWTLLAAALGAQVAWQAARGVPAAEAEDLPPAPTAAMLRAAALGEAPAAARLAMLYLQAFDLRGDNRIPYQRLDYARVAAWLGAILDADPKSGYALFSAARVYAENPDPAKCRAMLEFVYRAFFADPDRRWAPLAHAALLAKHRLGDLELARRYAQAIDRHTTDPGVPLWAKQMEIFILEDMNELAAARIMLGGLIASGKVSDPAELHFLQGRLKELEERLGGASKR
jgi:hypothetical protein